MVLEFMVLEFMELEFHELQLLPKISKLFHDLEYHGKLDFHKNEFQKGGRSLHISETVVDYKIFSKTVIFGHFDLH